MLNEQKMQAIRNVLLGAFDAVRNSIDANMFRDYILALLVLKYISDRALVFSTEPHEQSRDAADYRKLFDARYEKDIGLRIDRSLSELEASTPSLQDVFHGIHFDSNVFGNPEQSQRVLCQLLSIFNRAEFDFRTDEKQARETVAFAYETIISHVLAAIGRRGEAFFTPPEFSQLIARLMQPAPGESLCDPCCGSGALLLTCNDLARDGSGRACRLFGQEKNGSTWALAKINMVLHGEQNARIEWGDTLKEPKLIAAGSLQKFDVVVSSPPFNVKDWGQEFAACDAYGRYKRGIPPRAAADYAFISHMVESMNPETGRMAVVVSLGVLFRGGAEQQIRTQLLQENLIDAVIGLPAKMFPHTAIPVALLVLRKKKADRKVLFVDASRDYQNGKTQNALRLGDVTKIANTYWSRQDVDGYARVVSLDEIQAQDSNLNVARYVDAIEEVGPVDLAALRAERATLKAELAVMESRLATLLDEAVHG